MWNPLGSLGPYAPDQMGITSANTQGWRAGTPDGGLDGPMGLSKDWFKGLGLKGRDIRFLMDPQSMAGRMARWGAIGGDRGQVADWYGAAPVMPTDLQAAGALDAYRQNIVDWAGARPSRGGF